MESETNKLLQFFPFSSSVDTSFWHVLSQNKLNVYKLDDKAINITGFYRNDQALDLPPFASFTYESFNDELSEEQHRFPIYGSLLIYNTIEDFKNANKNQLLQDIGDSMFKEWTDNEIPNTLCSTLSRALLITFADIKKYQYYYWFAFPALAYLKNVTIKGSPTSTKDLWTKDQIDSFNQQLTALSASVKAYCVTIVQDSSRVAVMSLNKYDHSNHSNDKKVLFTYCDPCSNASHPGWPLRNFLAYLNVKFAITECDVLSVRHSKGDISSSLVFTISLGNEKNQTPTCVGWEKNEKQKLGPRFVDLSTSFDPVCLAEGAVDLNLKLMRWRLIPSLELERISQTSCLLLGAGTLGCNVARGLLGWGIKNITFLDSGRVSFSNPVRQSLFEFQDCLGSGKFKAEAAAEALKRIYPSVNARGVVMSVPMPGHPPGPNTIDQLREDIAHLEALIDSHDVIFLLMDTRESRWLPTMIAQSKRKLVINAALGFDTYLVQRHGVRKAKDLGINEENGLIPGFNLGCYFCNDVVAPGNSTRHRTLDQQCTVTRPGISMLAAGVAVELMISVVQHPLGYSAPAAYVWDEDTPVAAESALGIVPHQVRAFLSQFTQLMPTSKAFDCCTGCSPLVIEAYEKEGFEFLLKAFEDTDFLETLTGLRKLHQEINADDIWALSDEGSCESL